MVTGEEMKTATGMSRATRHGQAQEELEGRATASSSWSRGWRGEVDVDAASGRHGWARGQAGRRGAEEPVVEGIKPWRGGARAGEERKGRAAPGTEAATGAGGSAGCEQEDG